MKRIGSQLIHVFNDCIGFFFVLNAEKMSFGYGNPHVVCSTLICPSG
ncbi:MAG: hypothetical protein K6G46_07675 [Prevotella sp.]|nr:hypothetical protein [Prevotella sp.]